MARFRDSKLYVTTFGESFSMYGLTYLCSHDQVDTLDQNHWNLKYPNTFTSLSPMLCIVAEDIIDYRQSTILF
jgi:hypothetical protein